MGTQLPLKWAQPPIFGSCICGQTPGWIKMPVDTEVGLGPGDILLDRGPARPVKGATLTMAITLSILDRFAKFFHCCKEH